MDPTRIEKQLNFIVETDKLKDVFRKTRPIGSEKFENSAEHSWQVALSAMLLLEHSNEAVDLLKVLKMLLIHDVVEVDVGDVFHHHKHKISDLHEREAKAAERLFGMLPPDQKQEYIEIWQEFEARESPEARYAGAVDRLMGVLMNAQNGGGSWVEYQLQMSTVLKNNRYIEDGAKPIWEQVEKMVSSLEQQGVF